MRNETPCNVQKNSGKNLVGVETAPINGGIQSSVSIELVPFQRSSSEILENAENIRRVRRMIYSIDLFAVCITIFFHNFTKSIVINL